MACLPTHRAGLAAGLLAGGLVAACQPPTTSAAAQVKRAGMEQQLTDSLRRYQHLRSFWLEGDSGRYVVWGQQTEAGPLGVVSLTDSVLLVFQAAGSGRRRQVIRVSFPDHVKEVRVENLNGDDLEDLLVYGRRDFHGQAFPYVFMQTSRGLRYRPDVSLPDMSYEVPHGMMRSWYIGGANATFTKSLYQWRHDSLRQVAGAERPPGDRPLVRVFRVRGSRRYDVRTYRHPFVFDTVFFTDTR